MRTHALPIVLAIAGLTLATPAALGEGEAPVSPSGVSVSNEATGAACGNVTVTNHVASSNCTVHATSNGTVDMIGHTIFGETISARCNNEFTGAVNGTGAGVIGMNQIAITNPASGGVDCPPNSGGVTQCSEATASGAGHSADWDLQGYEGSEGQNWLLTEICIENTLIGTVAGDLWIRVNDAAGDDHVTSFSANQTATPNGGHAIRNLEAGALGPEFWGSWNVEGNTIEIAH